MSEIKFDKETYDTKIGYLSYMGEYILPVVNSGVDVGSNISVTLDSYYTMYQDIIRLLRLYKWSLQHAGQALQNAGDALYQTDQNLSKRI